MRTKRRYTDRDTMGFDLSISDLMSALCGIFTLIMICVITQLNYSRMEYASKNKMAQDYYSMQTELYEDLVKEFKDDLKEWNAEITPDLTIRFKDDDNTDPMFMANESSLNTKYKKRFKSFFPRLVKILSKKGYINEIEEIRIEGHTAPVPRMQGSLEMRNKDYKRGMELSQERTREVMLYCLATIPNLRESIQKNIVCIGYSNSRPVNKYSSLEENMQASRRVEFKIKTKAEKVIEELRELEI